MMSNTNLEKCFLAIWRRALNEADLGSLRAETVQQWAAEKNLANPKVSYVHSGAFCPIPSIVLEVAGEKACFPLVPVVGDPSWEARRKIKDDEAVLWEKVEWFSPLWISLEKTNALLKDIRFRSKAQALDLFDYHTSTLYTLAFEAVCIAQIMPQSRSLQEMVPLAREAYLGLYSGYRASSIAGLIPAMEGGLTRIVSHLGPHASFSDKIDHAIDRAIATAANLHFDNMWVPAEYKTVEYLFAEDERVFAFETFRRWLRDSFFCNTETYTGLTGLNRHMFAHATTSSWQKPTNFTRLIVALTTLAAIESWYDESHRVSFWLPEMDEDSKLLWQQAQLRCDMQSNLKMFELDHYHKHGRLVPELPTDDGVLLRQAILSDDCMRDLVRPLREAGWMVEVLPPDDRALYMNVIASHSGRSFEVALLYSCGTSNEIYKMLAEKCEAILYRGAPYKQKEFAYGIATHVGPVLGWQPPLAPDFVGRGRWRESLRRTLRKVAARIGLTRRLVSR